MSRGGAASDLSVEVKMMLRFALLAGVVLFSMEALGQCPAIQFVSSSAVSTYPAGVTASSGLQRLADGSFTRHTYNRTAPYARLQTTPGFQTNFTSCSTRTTGTPTPPPNRPLLTNDMLGAESRNPFIVDLANNGTGTVLLVGTFFGFTDQLFVGQTNADGSTKSSATYAVGKTPNSILTADFNNDGKRDVVTINVGNGTGPGSFSVLLGNGDGTLRTATTTATTFGPGLATVSDLNGDGKMDLVIVMAENPGGVAVYLGKGDGTFQAPVTYSTGSFAFGITITDLNGDAKLDVVVTSPAGSYSTLRGNGDGTFPK